MQSAAPIPVVLCVDVEPDVRHVDLASPSAWAGLPATWELLDLFRASASAASGADAHFSWYLRMDPQVEAGYGSWTWVADEHARLVDTMREAGDQLGLHVHAFRLSADHKRWTVDYEDAAWIDHCLTGGFEAFEQALGERCTTFRFGDHWMNQAAFNRLESLGVEVDLTVEPGHRGVDFYRSVDAFAGEVPDFGNVPGHPYRPSRDDYRSPDPERTSGPWILPVTTARVRPRLIHQLYRRYVTKRNWGATTAALVSHDPVLFMRVIDEALSRPAPHLVLPLRSGAATNPRYASRIAANLAALLARPEGKRLVWETPAGAIRLLESAR